MRGHPGKDDAGEPLQIARPQRRFGRREADSVPKQLRCAEADPGAEVEQARRQPWVNRRQQQLCRGRAHSEQRRRAERQRDARP